MATVSVRHHEMFIDGKGVDSGEVFEIVNPATGELYATMAKGSVEHLDQAVEAAKRSFESGVWSRRSPEERAAVMRKIADRVNDEAEELMELEICANGATVRQATGFHVGLAGTHFLHFAELAETFEWERTETMQYPTLSMNKIVKEPIGVVGGIIPWNFPLVLGIWKIGPGLAAGNSLVIKPDEKTPLSTLRLAQIAHECGVPDGVFNVVSGIGEEVGARLAAHPDVRKIAFTGSTAVGREIMKLASGTVKKCSLELGGKGPSIVLEDADIDAAVDASLFACWLYCGQMCESLTRLFLPESIHDEFVEKLIARAKTVKLGDIMDFDTDMGPIINQTQLDRILEYIQIGKDEGATCVLGGDQPTGGMFDKGYWVNPTIFTDVTNDMRIAREEIFGPVLSVIKYTDVEDAIAQANDSEYGLSAGVWSSDYEQALEIAGRIEAGTVWINDGHMVNVAMPFGGYKQSGLGREIGPDALNEYTETKHLHVDLTQKREARLYTLLLGTEPEDA